MKQTKALEDSIKEARNLGQEAIKVVEEEKNESLVLIMSAMINREF